MKLTININLDNDKKSFSLLWVLLFSCIQSFTMEAIPGCVHDRYHTSHINTFISNNNSVKLVFHFTHEPGEPLRDRQAVISRCSFCQTPLQTQVARPQSVAHVTPQLDKCQCKSYTLPSFVSKSCFFLLVVNGGQASVDL